MPSMGRAGRQLRSLFWRPSVAEQVEAELDLHLELLTRELMAAGMPREAARAEALRRFGDLRAVGDACRRIGEGLERDIRRTEYLMELRQDLAFAARQLRRARGFAAVAILTLAAGIGSTTAIFSVTDAVVLRALPFPHPERVVRVLSLQRGEGTAASPADFLDWRERSRGVFAHLAAGVSQAGFTLTGGDVPELIGGGRVTADYFAVFGVAPALGRTFLAEEDAPGANRVVVLSHRLWARRFGADPRVIGRELALNGEPYSVVGVMPASFEVTPDGDELWVPLALTPEERAQRGARWLQVVGRLRPAVSRERAQGAMAGVVRELAARYPDVERNVTVEVRGFADELVGGYRARLLILLGAVGLVLLIACANVANLLLARGAARAKEIALRVALGATRSRVVRQLLTESLVLALAGAAVGLALVHWLVRGLVAIGPPDVPRLDQAHVDGRALAFALGAAVASSVLFGLVPALRAARTDLQGMLREGGRGSSLGAARDRLRALLIGAEVALAITLLTGAGLLIRSAILVQRVHPGFDPRGVITARMILPASRYGDAAHVVAAYRRIREEVAGVPGVTAAALASVVPMSGSQMVAGVGAADRPATPETVVQSNFRLVSGGYFGALGVPLRRGRDLTERDDAAGPRVVVVNEALARKLWPGEDPLGKRMTGMGGGRNQPRPQLDVVGVVGDVRDAGLDREVRPEFYIPVAQTPPELWAPIQRSLVVVARSRADAATLERPLRRAVARVDPALPLAEVRTMEQYLAASVATARFNTILLSALGAMALLLAAVGIYGVVAYFVGQRRQEIGIRMALGATPGAVLRLVVQRGLTPVLAGAAVGLVAAGLTTRVLRSQLYGVSATDPATFLAVAAVLIGAALLAALLPARRAMRVDAAAVINAG